MTFTTNRDSDITSGLCTWPAPPAGGLAQALGQTWGCAGFESTPKALDWPNGLVGWVHEKKSPPGHLDPQGCEWHKAL